MPKSSLPQASPRTHRLSPKQRQHLEMLRDCADLPPDKFRLKFWNAGNRILEYSIPPGWIALGWYGDGLHRPTVGTLLKWGYAEKREHEYRRRDRMGDWTFKLEIFRITDAGRAALGKDGA